MLLILVKCIIREDVGGSGIPGDFERNLLNYDGVDLEGLVIIGVPRF